MSVGNDGSVDRNIDRTSRSNAGGSLPSNGVSLREALAQWDSLKSGVRYPSIPFDRVLTLRAAALESVIEAAREALSGDSPTAPGPTFCIYRGGCMRKEKCTDYCRERESPDETKKDGVGNEFDAIKAAIHADPSYGWSWHCNIAVPMLDAKVGITHAQANMAACHVMQHLFRFDSSKCEEWGCGSPEETSRDSEPVTVMLPNNHHPGAGCSCRECLSRWSDNPRTVEIRPTTLDPTRSWAEQMNANSDQKASAPPDPNACSGGKCGTVLGQQFYCARHWNELPENAAIDEENNCG